MRSICHGSRPAGRTIRTAQSFGLFLLLGILFLVPLAANAQSPPVDGMRPADLRRHAIVGATVIPRPGETIENAVIIIRDGVIESVGEGLDVPAGYRV
ncbi:MAG: hypothetical protein EA377_01065, partial [Phycisphaerales bacterium]